MRPANEWEEEEEDDDDDDDDDNDEYDDDGDVKWRWDRIHSTRPKSRNSLHASPMCVRVTETLEDVWNWKKEKKRTMMKERKEKKEYNKKRKEKGKKQDR